LPLLVRPYVQLHREHHYRKGTMNTGTKKTGRNKGKGQGRQKNENTRERDKNRDSKELETMDRKKRNGYVYHINVSK